MPLPVPARAVLTVDVEEWYHSCWIPEYVDPRRRPALPEELDHFLPELLERFDRLGIRATWFVLGEVARRLPQRIRELAAAGHEVACHGELHLRANERGLAAFRADIESAKSLLEDILGQPVHGFRAPEWSLRSETNPRLRAVAESGFLYDSSLTAALGAGRRENGLGVRSLRWAEGATLIEAPPATWAGAARLPVGGWCGRLASPERLARSADAGIRRGFLPLFVVHPWELVDRPCPGVMTGMASFLHDAGRVGFGRRFDHLAGLLDFDARLIDCLGGASGPGASGKSSRSAETETTAVLNVVGVAQ